MPMVPGLIDRWRSFEKIDVLWQEARKIIVCRVSEVSPETLNEIQKFILEIHHHDPDGQAARYDTDRQNKPTLQNLPLIIDRENMLFEMDKVLTYLNEWNKKVWSLRINEWVQTSSRRYEGEVRRWRRITREFVPWASQENREKNDLAIFPKDHSLFSALPSLTSFPFVQSLLFIVSLQ